METEETLAQALIAVDGIVSTVHMGKALTEDPAAQELLHGVLLVALTARNLIEDRLEGGPVKEPQKDAYATMGQEEEPEVIDPRAALANCEHDGDFLGAMCVRCGEEVGNG